MKKYKCFECGGQQCFPLNVGPAVLANTVQMEIHCFECGHKEVPTMPQDLLMMIMTYWDLTAVGQQVAEVYRELEDVAKAFPDSTIKRKITPKDHPDELQPIPDPIDEVALW